MCFNFPKIQDGGYAQSQASYANGDHGSMALAGFPGRGTTQYTSVHHHQISHNDGDEDDDGYGAAGYAPGYAQGYAPNPVAFAPRMGAFGGLRGGPFMGARSMYHPRHVHVGVGTPGVKVEVETAKRAEVAAQVGSLILIVDISYEETFKKYQDENLKIVILDLCFEAEKTHFQEKPQISYCSNIKTYLF